MADFLLVTAAGSRTDTLTADGVRLVNVLDRAVEALDAGARAQANLAHESYAVTLNGKRYILQIDAQPYNGDAMVLLRLKHMGTR